MRRRIFAGLTALLVVGVVAAATIVVHLNGNLRTVKLIGGGEEKADGQGRKPINMLVMGSDTRASAQDCQIGGDCRSDRSTATGKSATSMSANADVEMLVHISADRSNATMMSLPRDSVVDIPACTDPATGAPTPAHRGRINSSLQLGPNCTIQTVHQLTGVPIDHFAVIDFGGVVTMSDAVGGVKVCVSSDVYDTYSHLKLSQGSHTLKGASALQFLRTRHGFGDGGDIGRTVAQHLFLSSMLRQMESGSTLANPVKLYNLANAATKAVTVDTGLGDVGKLTGLAKQLNKVPSDRETFTTMPTVPDPANSNEVVAASNAAALFAKIRDDTSLTPTKGSTAAPNSPSSTAPGGTPSSSSETSNTAGAGDDHATTVDKATGCAQVSKARTVQIDGVPMRPAEAYARASKVPDSAP